MPYRLREKNTGTTYPHPQPSPVPHRLRENTGTTYPPVQYRTRKKNTRSDNPEAIAETKAHLTVGFHVEIVIIFFAEHGHRRALHFCSAQLWIIVPNAGSVKENMSFVWYNILLWGLSFMLDVCGIYFQFRSCNSSIPYYNFYIMYYIINNNVYTLLGWLDGWGYVSFHLMVEYCIKLWIPILFHF